ncbi:MAG: hypothetical protein IJ668_10635 [Selenomonadaceae bacterium]|nr:hypothetical protein [Selenomonadaceae bacterium]
MGILIDREMLIQRYRDEHQEMIDNQNLLLETMTHLMDRADEAQDAIELLNDRLDAMDELLKSSREAVFDDLKQRIERIEEEVQEREMSIDAKLEQLAQTNIDILNRLSASSQRSEGIEKYLSSLEQLMRLIAANQLLDNEAQSHDSD